MKRMLARPPGALSAAILIFFVLMSFAGCKKDGRHPISAKGSLHNEYGACIPITTHGIWYNGITAGTDTNYVEISVDVTSPGYYRITTDRQNGVMFSASGIFTDTGLNRVSLTATGSFIRPATTNFTTTFDTTICQFQVYVQDSMGLSLADNTWQFTAGGHAYQGNATAGFFTLPQQSGNIFDFHGTTTSGSPDSTLTMSVLVPATVNFDTISYPTSSGASGLAFLAGNGTKVIYTAGLYTVPAVIDIHFRSFTVLLMPEGLAKSIIIGTFNGTARDTAENIVPITNAKFKIVH